MAYIFSTFLVGERTNPIRLVVLAKTARQACKKMSEWEDSEVTDFFEAYLCENGWESHEKLKKMLKIKKIDVEDPDYDCVLAMIDYASKVSKSEKKSQEFLSSLIQQEQFMEVRRQITCNGLGKKLLSRIKMIISYNNKKIRDGKSNS